MACVIETFLEVLAVTSDDFIRVIPKSVFSAML